jgi:hypothetical protein
LKAAAFHNIKKLLWIEHKTRDKVTIVYRVFMWKQFGYLEP